MSAAPRIVSAFGHRLRYGLLAGVACRCLPEGKWLFVTWHLHGSSPHGRYPPPGGPSAGKAFVWMDRYLDQAATGPDFS